MKKVKWVLVSSLVLFLFSPGNLSAEEIGILPFRTIGVESYVEDAVYEFLEDELAYYDHRVVSPYEIEDYLGHRVICYNKDYAADYGRSLGLEKVIFGSITRFGEKYVISATVVRSRTGEILLSDRITAGTEDELDVCVYRLVDFIEEEIYGNVIYYGPTYSRTVTRVYIGGYWHPRIIWRRPHRTYRSLITVRLPLITINLGKSHNIPRSHPPRMEPRHEEPSHGKPGHEKTKKENPGHEKPKDEKPHGDNDGQHNKGEKRPH